jgi:enamine deaminase RidA (YjgF/YER057c/UK114 family)
MTAIERQQIGPCLSQACTHGPTVYLAGQVADDPQAGVMGQTGQILRKIDQLLEGAGTNKRGLLSATIWLSDIGTFRRHEQALGRLGRARQHARRTGPKRDRRFESRFLQRRVRCEPISPEDLRRYQLHLVASGAGGPRAAGRVGSRAAARFRSSSAHADRQQSRGYGDRGRRPPAVSAA